MSCDSGSCWIDLRLPSGTLWAECNIGATSPEQYGNYYAWGETQPKTVYDWSTYRHCGGYKDKLNKYCTERRFGIVDNLSVLLPVDDVATEELGNDAHIPTKEQWQELLNNTQCEWMEYNGVYGRRFTGVDGKTIFLPAAGIRSASGLYTVVMNGGYWSSSLYEDNPDHAWCCYFGSGGQGMYDDDRYGGLSLRAVRN